MGLSSTYKLLQKRSYDVLSHRYGTICVICGVLLVIASAFQFGEVVMEWSTEKYAAVFNSFSDNIAGKSYRQRLCLPVPIDVVYTWVNGSDTDLLEQLHMYKRQMETSLNVTKENSTNTTSQQCPFANCLPSPLAVLEPNMPSSVTQATVAILYPALGSALRMFQAVRSGDDKNVTVLEFETEEQVKAALETKVVIEGKNATIARGYYTTDLTIRHSVTLDDTLLMTGFPHTIEDEATLKATIPEKYLKLITKFEWNKDKGIAIIKMSDKAEMEALQKDSNITIETKTPTFTPAALVWDLIDDRLSEDVAANRFMDNEELRYSLRSVQHFAPWVRHVYIVTNGQIPSWLNLDSSRLTVVTHQEIFPNTTHLPTFSSPAIESHLHRIPGLSDKFIYMNDDVMFGKEVWPDDFYTHAHGQKVYLTWPVPNCREGCPSTWIRDGYCDKACNNTECEWDGGDCGPGAANRQHEFGNLGAWGGGGASDEMYCNSGCANNWIADRYCDNACNVHQCGFDAGDCGTDNYNKLNQFKLDANSSHFALPKGETMFYFNVSTFLGEEGKMEEGNYDENDVIRSVAIAQKFGVVTVVLYAGKNSTELKLQLTGKDKEEHKLSLNLTISVDTTPDKSNASKATNLTEEVKKTNETLKANETKVSNETKEVFIFDDVALDILEPKAIALGLPAEVIQQKQMPNMSDYELPEDIGERYQELVEGHKEGEFTEKGYLKQLGLLWEELLAVLKKEGKELVKATPKPVVENDEKEIDANKDEVEKREIEKQEKDGEKKGEIEKQENDGVKEGGIKEGKREINDEEEAKLERGDDGINNEQQQQQQQQQQKEQKQQIPIKVTQPHHKEEEGEKVADINPPENVAEPKVNDSDGYVLKDGIRSRKLNAVAQFLGDEGDDGFLPWEKQGMFADIQKAQHLQKIQSEYESAAIPQRHLLDTFGDSLRHVNKLYNKAFGYQARKVPGHMPHMIDRNIMLELQDMFAPYWEVTSSHRVRSSDDMQYAFSYFYFLMGEENPFDIKLVFDKMDTDKSGVLSDREIRTLATRLYELPLDLQTLTSLENKFSNCSRHVKPETSPPYRQEETYYDKNMPQITEYLFCNCPEIIDLVKKKFPANTKYKYEITGDEDIAFKMIRTNVSSVVGQLDDIRKNPKKFICLNDNIDHVKPDAKTVQAVLQDFYESILPIQSEFELPREYRNRFTHMDELRQWRKYRDWLKLWTQIALTLLVLFTVASFFQERIDSLQRRVFGRRGSPEPSSKPLQSV